MTGELIGRASERDLLLASIERPPRRVVVVGEAGVGKTSLVRRTVPGAREGGAFASLTWKPYLPLQRALPEVADWAGDEDYVAATVEAALGDDLLFLDDLQWADLATWDVLERLGARVGVVATVRQEDAASPAAVERLAGLGFERLDLEPLGGGDAASLARQLRPDLSSRRLDEVVAGSGGNPLLIEELVRVDGAVDALRLALGIRLGSLDDATREGLLLLAVADRPMPPDDLPSVERLLEMGLVVAEGDGDGASLLVRHRALAESLLEIASAEQLRSAHAQLAAAATSDAERAPHLASAGDHEAAFSAAMAAADLAATPGERLLHLRLAGSCAPADRAVEVTIDTARAANDAGRPSEAHSLLERLPEEVRRRADVLVEWGRALFELGDAEGWHKSVIEGSAAADTPRQRAYFAGEEAAVAYFLHGDARRAVEIAEPAVLDAERDGAPHGGVLRILATARYLLGEPTWTETMERAVARSEEEGDLSGKFAALNNLVSGHESAGDPAVGARLAEEAAEEAGRLRLTRWQRHFRTRQLSLALHAGDHERVETLARDLLDEPLMPRSREEVACAYACSLTDVGRTDEALALAEEHLRHATIRPSDYHVVRALAFAADGRPAAALGERDHFLGGEPVDSMVAIMAPVFAWAAHEAGREPPDEGELPSWGMLAGVPLELAALERLRRGDHAAAATRFGEAAEAYAGYHLRGELRCAWGRGLALATGGDGAAADELAEVAERAEAAGFRPLAARVLGSGRRPPRSAPSALTGREREVVRLVGEGLSDVEIAGRLGSSPRTIHSQLASARRKLGARNRHHAFELLQQQS